MTSPSRPAGLSGDAGPTPEEAWPDGAVTARCVYCGWFAMSPAEAERHECGPKLRSDLAAAVERVGQLEALVRAEPLDAEATADAVRQILNFARMDASPAEIATGLRRALVAGGALGATMKRFDRLVAEVRDLRLASPRREAPADAVEALAQAMYPLLVNEYKDMSAYLSERVARDIAMDVLEADPRLQLVPDGHHVSREGQTVIDGKRWEVEMMGGMADLIEGAFHALLRPVGAEEADTDG